MTRLCASPHTRTSDLPGVSLLQRQCACSDKASEVSETCLECKRSGAFPAQRKLLLDSADSPLEREADRAARWALAAPGPVAASYATPRIQAHTGREPAAGEAVPASVHATLDNGGRALDQPLRQDMEQRFGHNFSGVRIHTDALAGRSAREVRAHAYTVGQHVVFAPGRYTPETQSGRHLLAHELAHVIQQAGGTTHRRALLQRHKDDLVIYSGGQSGQVHVIDAGRLVFSGGAVSGHPGRGENEPGAGPIPSGRYVIRPRITRPTVATLQRGVCGANAIPSGYQHITSTDKSPCSGAHYCNVSCPTPADPTRKCFTPKDCWGEHRIKIEGSQAVVTPLGKRKIRSGFYLHGGNPKDAVSSGCVKSLGNDVFSYIRKLTGVRNAVPFCVGASCDPHLQSAIGRTVSDATQSAIEAVKEWF